MLSCCTQQCTEIDVTSSETECWVLLQYVVYHGIKHYSFWPTSFVTIVCSLAWLSTTVAYSLPYLQCIHIFKY